MTQNIIQKTLILASLVAASSTITVAFGASTMPELANAQKATEKATVQTVELDAKYGYSSSTGLIEKNDDEILVYAFFDRKCVPGRMCSDLMRAPLIFRAPIVSHTVSCGSEVYTARVDRRMVDGNLLEITVTDNTKRLCMDKPFGRVSAVVSEDTLRGLRYTSTFISGDGFAGNLNKIDLKTAQDTFTLDKEHLSDIFGKVFSVESATLEKTADSHLVLTVKPHTIYCAMIIGLNCPHPQTFAADLSIAVAEKSIDGCGSKITQARGEVTLADGSKVPASLKIQDNSSRICEDYRPNMTEVNFDVQVNDNEVAHNFFGSDSRLN